MFRISKFYIDYITLEKLNGWLCCTWPRDYWALGFISFLFFYLCFVKFIICSISSNIGSLLDIFHRFLFNFAPLLILFPLRYFLFFSWETLCLLDFLLSFLASLLFSYAFISSLVNQFAFHPQESTYEIIRSFWELNMTFLFPFVVYNYSLVKNNRSFRIESFSSSHSFCIS